MKKGIAIAGNLIVDYVKNIDCYPKQGMLSNIVSISRCVGGCAANTLTDLAKIDPSVPLQCIGMVGDDENGQYILSVLNKHGIDTSLVAKSGQYDTSFTDVMSALDTGERTFFHARGANAGFSFDHIDFNKIHADLFHIGYALLLDAFDAEDKEYGTVMAKTLAKAKEAGFKTSMDVVSENSNRFKKVVTPSLKYCDYLIINEVEASMITGIDARDEKGIIRTGAIEKICSELFKIGILEKVVIHAPEAGWSMEKDGRFTCVTSLKLPAGYIKGTVGAGDSFCAGILYSIYNDFDPEYSLRVASASAAANLSSENSIDGMRSFNEILELEREFGR